MITSLKLVNSKNFADEKPRVGPPTVIVGTNASSSGVSDAPGGGRKPPAEKAARQMIAIRQKCVEDFDALARRIEAVA